MHFSIFYHSHNVLSSLNQSWHSSFVSSKFSNHISQPIRDAVTFGNMECHYYIEQQYST